DQRTKKWGAANKVLGPVDRIDNPSGVHASGLSAKLFPHHPIIGEGPPQCFGSDLLAGPVRHGHRRLLVLRFTLQGRAEMGESDLPSRFGSRNSAIEMLL